MKALTSLLLAGLVGPCVGRFSTQPSYGLTRNAAVTLGDLSDQLADSAGDTLLSPQTERLLLDPGTIFVEKTRSAGDDHIDSSPSPTPSLSGSSADSTPPSEEHEAEQHATPSPSPPSTDPAKAKYMEDLEKTGKDLIQLETFLLENPEKKERCKRHWDIYNDFTRAKAYMDAAIKLQQDVSRNEYMAKNADDKDAERIGKLREKRGKEIRTDFILDVCGKSVKKVHSGFDLPPPAETDFLRRALTESLYGESALMKPEIADLVGSLKKEVELQEKRFKDIEKKMMSTGVDSYTDDPFLGTICHRLDTIGKVQNQQEYFTTCITEGSQDEAAMSTDSSPPPCHLVAIAQAMAASLLHTSEDLLEEDAAFCMATGKWIFSTYEEESMLTSAREFVKQRKGLQDQTIDQECEQEEDDETARQADEGTASTSTSDSTPKGNPTSFSASVIQFLQGGEPSSTSTTPSSSEPSAPIVSSPGKVEFSKLVTQWRDEAVLKDAKSWVVLNDATALAPYRKKPDEEGYLPLENDGEKKGKLHDWRCGKYMRALRSEQEAIFHLVELFHVFQSFTGGESVWARQKREAEKLRKDRLDNAVKKMQKEETAAEETPLDGENGEKKPSRAEQIANWQLNSEKPFIVSNWQLEWENGVRRHAAVSTTTDTSPSPATPVTNPDTTLDTPTATATKFLQFWKKTDETLAKEDTTADAEIEDAHPPCNFETLIVTSMVCEGRAAGSSDKYRDCVLFGSMRCMGLMSPYFSTMKPEEIKTEITQGVGDVEKGFWAARHVFTTLVQETTCVPAMRYHEEYITKRMTMDMSEEDSLVKPLKIFTEGECKDSVWKDSNVENLACKLFWTTGGCWKDQWKAVSKILEYNRKALIEADAIAAKAALRETSLAFHQARSDFFLLHKLGQINTAESTASKRNLQKLIQQKIVTLAKTQRDLESSMRSASASSDTGSVLKFLQTLEAEAGGDPPQTPEKIKADIEAQKRELLKLMATKHGQAVAKDNPSLKTVMDNLAAVHTGNLSEEEAAAHSKQLAQMINHIDKEIEKGGDLNVIDPETVAAAASEEPTPDLSAKADHELRTELQGKLEKLKEAVNNQAGPQKVHDLYADVKNAIEAYVEKAKNDPAEQDGRLYRIEKEFGDVIDQMNMQVQLYVHQHQVALAVESGKPVPKPPGAHKETPKVDTAAVTEKGTVDAAKGTSSGETKPASDNVGGTPGATTTTVSDPREKGTPDAAKTTSASDTEKGTPGATKVASDTENITPGATEKSTPGATTKVPATSDTSGEKAFTPSLDTISEKAEKFLQEAQARETAFQFLEDRKAQLREDEEKIKKDGEGSNAAASVLSGVRDAVGELQSGLVADSSPVSGSEILSGSFQNALDGIERSGVALKNANNRQRERGQAPAAEAIAASFEQNLSLRDRLESPDSPPMPKGLKDTISNFLDKGMMEGQDGSVVSASPEGLDKHQLLTDLASAALEIPQASTDSSLLEQLQVRLQAIDRQMQKLDDAAARTQQAEKGGDGLSESESASWQTSEAPRKPLQQVPLSAELTKDTRDPLIGLLELGSEADCNKDKTKKWDTSACRPKKKEECDADAEVEWKADKCQLKGSSASDDKDGDKDAFPSAALTIPDDKKKGLCESSLGDWDESGKKCTCKNRAMLPYTDTHTCDFPDVRCTAPDSGGVWGVRPPPAEADTPAPSKTDSAPAEKTEAQKECEKQDGKQWKDGKCVAKTFLQMEEEEGRAPTASMMLELQGKKEDCEKDTTKTWDETTSECKAKSSGAPSTTSPAKDSSPPPAAAGDKECICPTSKPLNAGTGKCGVASEENPESPTIKEMIATSYQTKVEPVGSLPKGKCPAADEYEDESTENCYPRCPDPQKYDAVTQTCVCQKAPCDNEACKLDNREGCYKQTLDQINKDDGTPNCKDASMVKTAKGCRCKDPTHRFEGDSCAEYCKDDEGKEFKDGRCKCKPGFTAKTAESNGLKTLTCEAQNGGSDTAPGKKTVQQECEKDENGNCKTGFLQIADEDADRASFLQLQQKEKVVDKASCESGGGTWNDGTSICTCPAGQLPDPDDGKCTAISLPGATNSAASQTGPLTEAQVRRVEERRGTRIWLEKREGIVGGVHGHAGDFPK
uniref:Uncharacterized protein n=1 Tax=Chromera velia CCMP2878 TaxID=1169474 RepID=A0A0G4HTY7_9ALVE|eukprot:Cvel_8552.t1-p1 / transcript=Cvel_8552.t1 / gene=Cvel_8552 / organism=Chromera_velia_CCMP2878 / gene_product=Balbiani ring protein 3, putative / transcript_product=Balbiani ring protein 3, putative / location=Cvel_scaffold474:41304-63961(-) / protein_length=2126 / sequence_SO=supercontig / SO=protein_coding / is_pseudo=false